MKEERVQSVKNSSAITDAKRAGSPLLGAFRKLKSSNNNHSNTETIPTSKEVSPSIPLSNIVFLVDGSSSMKKGKGKLCNFGIAIKAIEKILTHPNPMAKDNVLSVIIFWDEIIKGFRKDILYENVSMSKYINPQRLSRFGKPKSSAGTPLWHAVDYTIGFLQEKKGSKIIKLITDAVDISPLKDKTKISKLEKNSIELDFIIVGSEGNVELEKAVRNYKWGRFFECSEIESLVLALEA